MKGCALTVKQRTPYLFSTLSVLRRRIAGRTYPAPRPKDAALIQLICDINALLKWRIEHLPLNGWKSYKPLKKCYALLTAIHRRFPKDDHAALVIIATVIGTALALKIEPGVEQGDTYRAFQQMVALGSIMRPEVIKAHNGLILSKARPRPTGRYLVGYLHHLIVTPIMYYATKEAGPELEQAILRHMLRYPSKKQRAIRFIPSTRKVNP